MKKFKGELEGFPKEVVKLMLKRQVEQGNEKNVSAFEEHSIAGKGYGGFGWDDTYEGYDFWCHVILNKKFNLFFEKYPKKKKNKKGVRDYNVGKSDYSKHSIQPWDIWIEYDLNPFDADIIKRVLRQKEGEDRKLDYEKIIHICKERIRQLS